MSEQGSPQALLAECALGYDTKNPDAVVACWTEDAEFTWAITDGASGGPYIGRAAIRERTVAGMVRSDVRRHILTNVVVEVDGDVARSRAYLTLTSAQDGVVRLLTTGVYTDELRRIDGRWLIHRRHLQTDTPF